MAYPRKTRSLQEICMSDVVKIEGEAPALVPVSALTLRRRHKEGRLECFGKPLSVDRQHLLSQFRNGFKPLA